MRRLWHDSDGSALLEGALVMPLLFALMLGVYEFSWYFYQQHLIEVGVRDSDSFNGVIWTTGPNGGTPQVWSNDPLLGPGTGLTPPFGANGIEFNNEGTPSWTPLKSPSFAITLPVVSMTVILSSWLAQTQRLSSWSIAMPSGALMPVIKMDALPADPPASTGICMI
jgi:hypothetical protein